jgi:hypothetical protein
MCGSCDDRHRPSSRKTNPDFAAWNFSAPADVAAQEDLREAALAQRSGRIAAPNGFSKTVPR